ncbi:aldo/keto reductase [Myroides marinus]|uniref:aldo/keto reductase n=1 Tax=Myroides marinus TaxID=703342 RepID=UPI002577896D|nr:aldo/keto reductase [Myroides marinus]MDM1348603.1 aldo/keto reductase [Myroides marinus]MDM1352243.1 aldo/keto reductase [Myroides marinus]MDM1355704.1 aldo/keto reductase [Myroides marinus]MDM1359449.1 aldo/keto reductase [Myroides marinus]MDM1361237.1 aldo/keto reductase [Myroides marinus]
MNTYILSNGVHIPQLGFGTWKAAEGEQAESAVLCALATGYLHIDTASFYKNEKSIGRAIAKSGVAREDLFVTTKLWNEDRGYEQTLKAFELSLSNLGLEYLDLYLIHWPATAHQFDNWKEINADTWRALEFLYKEGKVKAIGVSNFYVHHLEALLETAEIRPMINQIEFHPGFTQSEVVDYCKEESILIEAWSPIGRGNILNNEILVYMALKYGVTVPQLVLKWIIQKGHLPMPKSVTPERIKENFDIKKIIISEDDVVVIDNLPYIGASGLNPDQVDF